MKPCIKEVFTCPLRTDICRSKRDLSKPLSSCKIRKKTSYDTLSTLADKGFQRKSSRSEGVPSTLLLFINHHHHYQAPLMVNM